MSRRRYITINAEVDLGEFDNDDIRDEFDERFGETKTQREEHAEMIATLERLREFLLVEHVDAVALEATRTALRDILGTAL